MRCGREMFINKAIVQSQSISLSNFSYVVITKPNAVLHALLIANYHKQN
jgi:hypothetical protein